MAKLAVLPLARSTFDLGLADSMLATMLARLDIPEYSLVSSSTITTDQAEADAAIEALHELEFDILLVLQITFTDALSIKRVAREFEKPISVWATSELRSGGRLRLNSFCGLNLASHALGLIGRDFRWLYRDPSQVTSGDIRRLLSVRKDSCVPATDHLNPPPTENDLEDKRGRTKGARIGVIGEHPPGFDTCSFDPEVLRQLADIGIVRISLSQLFEHAACVDQSRADNLVDEVRNIEGFKAVDYGQLDRSVRLKLALDDLKHDNKIDAFAVRCWPECFTEYGGAICGPVSMISGDGVPCACECDVMGALSQLIMGSITGQPTFLTDIVDMDESDNTGVVWHCGQAPLSMCAPGTSPHVTVHSNRGMPLLFQFPLRPGEITMMRVSQSRGRLKLILFCGEILPRKMAFSGTSGVVRFERTVSELLPDLIESRMEHHVVVGYGDHRTALRAIANNMGLPTVEL